MRKKVDERIRTLIENGVRERHRSLFVIVGDKSRDQIVNLNYMLAKSRVKSRPSVLWCYRDKLEISRRVVLPLMLLGACSLISVIGDGCMGAEFLTCSGRSVVLQSQEEACQADQEAHAAGAHGPREGRPVFPLPGDVGHHLLPLQGLREGPGKHLRHVYPSGPATSSTLSNCHYYHGACELLNCCCFDMLQDFEALTPNLLARTIETVEGGGLIILLLHSLSSLTSLYTMVMVSFILPLYLPSFSLFS
jgi:hypothetical protein